MPTPFLSTRVSALLLSELNKLLLYAISHLLCYVSKFTPAFTSSTSITNAFFTGGKDPGKNSFYPLDLLVWGLGFLVLIQATQVQFPGRELRSCFRPICTTALSRSPGQPRSQENTKGDRLRGRRGLDLRRSQFPSVYDSSLGAVLSFGLGT